MCAAAPLLLAQHRLWTVNPLTGTIIEQASKHWLSPSKGLKCVRLRFVDLRNSTYDDVNFFCDFLHEMAFYDAVAF
jgi:hypothetical protein